MNWSRKKTAVTVAALLAAVYAGGAAYFQNHSFPKTSVDGQDRSMVTDGEIMDTVRTEATQGTLTIKVQDKEYTLNAPEVLAVADENAVHGAVIGTRNPYAWPVEVFRTHELSSGRTVAFLKDAAAAKLEEQGLLGLEIPAVDAVMSDFAEETGYTVIPDHDGWKADREAVLEEIRKAAEAEQKELDLTETFAVKADVLADDKTLNDRCEELNRLAHHSFRVTVGDEEQVLSGEMLNSWLKDTSDGVTGLDALQIRAYAENLQESFGDKLSALQEQNGQRYIADPEKFLEIFAEKMQLDIPKPETDSEKSARESKNEKLMKQAEKKAKKAETEEEKKKILADAEAEIVPEPEMVALWIDPAVKASESNAEAEESEKNKENSDKEKKDGEEEEIVEENILKVTLRNGLYIENPLEPDPEEEAAKQEEEKKKKEEEAKKKEEEAKKKAADASASNAEQAEEEPEEEEKTPEITIEEVIMDGDQIHVPLLEADPQFQMGFGLSYVEVDIPNQHVTYFENGRKYMESDCVTGIPNRSRATHPGVFKIDYKQRNRILRGSQNLYASFVNYWMPFDGGIGLHDATWRGSFGGTIYKYSGSHGCVNLPLSFAAKLYSRVYPGMTVYVH